MLKKTIVTDFDFVRYVKLEKRCMKLKNKYDINISVNGVMLEFCEEHLDEFIDLLGEEPTSYYFTLNFVCCCIKNCNNEASHRHFATWEELGLPDLFIKNLCDVKNCNDIPEHFQFAHWDDLLVVKNK